MQPAVSSRPARQATQAALLLTPLLLGSLAATGCRPHHTGADPQAGLVDESWITSAQSCWPDLTHNGYSTKRLQHDLAVPANFRATFPTYAAQSNVQIRALLSKTIGAAPSPDSSTLAHSQMPVLTRGQAAAGTSPQAAVAANTNGTAPPDALCAIQTGTPAGFR